LSQKARELEEVITTSSERVATDIGPLVEDIAKTITREYPEASISVEYDAEIRGRVLQNFDRAIEELVENAVKHSGDDPSVTVSIETVPNAIEIRISDNGPGLPEAEAEVLTAGEETPLAHGSGLGLWLAYWIVSSHDGSIDPEITERGTTMRVTVPRKPTVTANKQLTELTRSRDKYKTSFEEASDAILIINDDGRIIDANDAASTIFGVEENELLGRSLAEFFPDEFAFETEWQDFQETGDQRDTTTIIGADGVERVLEYAGTADIIPGQHLFISRDITERRQRERELGVAETVFQTTQDGLFLADVVGEEYRLNRVNEAFEVLTQRSREAITGKSPSELLGDEAGAEVQSQFDECVTSQDPVEFEQVVPADGGSRVWQVRVTPLVQDGDVTQLVGAMRNVTERKERETELEALQERYQTLLEAAPDPVFVADAETGELIEVSAAAETLLGLSSDEIVGRHQSELHPSEQAAQYRKFFERHLRSGGTRRRLPDGSPISVVTSDGERIPVEISVDTVQLPDGPVSYGIFRDISARVEREEELAEKTRQLEAIVQNTSGAIYIKDREGYYQFINESGAEIFGHTPAQVIGKRDADLFDSESAADIRADDTQVMESGEGMTVETSRFVDGEEHVFLDNKYPYRDDDGEIIGIIGISPDITEQKERERALRTRTRAIEKAPVGIVLSDPDQPDNPLVYANERFCELTGYEESEIRGRNCRFMQGPETDPESVAEIRDAIGNDEPASTVLRNYRNDGTMFWNRLTIAPIRDEDGDVTNWVGFQEGVTERLEREQQLELAETVFENTQDALFVVDVTEDREFSIERVNAVYEELTGLSNAAIAGRAPTDVVGEGIGGEIESQYHECVERQETISYPEEIPVDGEQRQWETKLTPVMNEGRVDKLVGAMRDVTAG
jgi:PAS domain S-box-containing protein